MSVQKVFKNAAAAGHATALDAFSQGKLFKAEQSKEIKKGICGGVSLTYLGLYAKSGAGSLNGAKAHSWSALLEFGLKLQQQLMDVPQGAVSVQQAMRTNFSNAAGTCGLRVDGAIASYAFPGDESIVGLVSRLSGYYIIALPVHYIAASNVGGEFTFFDPNCGAAYTNNARNFATMYRSFFSSSQVSDSYECTGKNLDILRFQRI